MGDGKNIAVKRLFKIDGERIQENMFMNESGLIAKCQHKNLVQLLGCCIEGDERILVFEFMPNNSLNSIIFGMCVIEIFQSQNINYNVLLNLSFV